MLRPGQEVSQEDAGPEASTAENLQQPQRSSAEGLKHSRPAGTGSFTDSQIQTSKAVSCRSID